MSPETGGQIAELMAANNARAQKMSSVDLRRLNRVIELAPEDMTVTVEAGILLQELQAELRTHGQWLPIDPPNRANISVHDVLAKDLSGPRRFGYGTVREHVIGMTVVLADGRTIKSGGKVVKNVAGYDLMKLFIGARDSLGIVIQATFKLRPLAEVERFVGLRLDALSDASRVLRAVLDSAMTPVVLDLRRSAPVPGAAISADSGAHGVSKELPQLNVVAPGTGALKSDELWIVLGFAGTAEQVEWQLREARTLGFETPVTLDYELEFWNDPLPVRRISVLPSRLTETIARLGRRPFIARAGNGVIYYHGEVLPSEKNLPMALMRRVKAAYDPNNILPEIPA